MSLMAMFEAVTGIDDEERRRAILRNLGADDARLAEVEALLRAGQRPMALLDAVDTPSQPVAGRDEEFVPDVGPRFGILRCLGRGGMGVVFEAEQFEPLRRRVALKVLQPDLREPRTVERFEAERQALASLEHPHVARALDAGVSAEGLPYMAMELVEGSPLTQYCDSRKLPLAERWRLLALVCDAVHHAHCRGLLHRDLKPSNLLVGDRDGRAWPTVIDFGVFASLRGEAGVRLGPQPHGGVYGTLLYMSPEQAAGEPDAADIRADVYSLGAIAYELAVGRPPFAEEFRDNTNLADCIRRMRAGVPAPRSLAKVPVDVEWVVQKAMAVDPAARYDSAAALAEDLRRLADGSAVAAGPQSARYRARKFAAQHWRLLASAATVLLALAAGLAGTSVGLARAQAAAQRSENLAEFLERELVRAGAPKGAKGGQGAFTWAEALETAERSIASSFADDPDTEVRLRIALSETFRILWKLDGSADQARRAWEVAQTRLRPSDLNFVRAQYCFGMNLLERRAFDDALAPLRAASEGFERILGPDHATAVTALSMYLEAVKPRDYRTARRLQREIWDRNRRLRGPESQEALFSAAAVALNLYEDGQLEEADRILLDALRASDASADLRVLSMLLRMYRGPLLVRQNRFDEAWKEMNELRGRLALPKERGLPPHCQALFSGAEAALASGRYTQAAEWARELAAVQGPPSSAWIKASDGEFLLGLALAHAGDRAGALAVLRKGLADARARPAHDRANAVFAVKHAAALGSVLAAAASQGSEAESEALLREAATKAATMSPVADGQNGWIDRFELDLARALALQALHKLLARTGRPDEAAVRARELDDLSKERRYWPAP